MGKGKTIKQMETTATGKDVVSVPEYDNGVGDVIENEVTSAEYANIVKLPLGYIRKAKVGDEDVEVSLRYNVPPEIEPGKHYAVCEWRIGSEDIQNADNVPQWKRLPLRVNGKIVMNFGRPVMVSHYVVISVEDVPETNQHERQTPFRDFHIDGPFSDGRIKVSDFGLPVFSGADIIEVKKAKIVLGKNGGYGSLRRRGQDTSGGPA